MSGTRDNIVGEIEWREDDAHNQIDPAALLKLWGVEDSISSALALVFRHQSIAPLNPYKTVIHSIRQLEQHLDIRPRNVLQALSNSPQITALGESNAAAMKHLAIAVSSSSLKKAISFIDTLRSQLGNPPANMKTVNFDAYFLEVFSVSSALSTSMALPRRHRAELTLEAVIRGKSFDECITGFIKRVIEEAFQAELCKDILTVNLKATMGRGSSHTIDIKTVKTKRAQVLSLIKSAVLDDGEVFIEMFVKSTAVLPALGADSVPYTDESTGFVHVIRRYRFTYTDDATGQSRCFSKYPLESLIRGIFCSSADIQLYRDAYLSHATRMSKSSYSSSSSSSSSSSAAGKNSSGSDETDPLLYDIRLMLAQRALSAMDTGEIVSGAEWLLQLQLLSFVKSSGAVKSSSASGSGGPTAFVDFYRGGAEEAAAVSSGTMAGNSIVLSQLSALLCQPSPCAQIRVVRDAVGTFRRVLETLRLRIEQSNSSLLAHHSNTITSDNDEDDDEDHGDRSVAQIDEDIVREVDKLDSLYSSLSPAVLQLRGMIQSLSRECVGRCSELSYLLPVLHADFSLLFDPLTRSKPLISPDNDLLQRRGLLGVLPLLVEIDKPLRRINNLLTMAESSVSLDILAALVKQDFVTEQAQQKAALKLTLNKNGRSSSSGGSGGIGIGGSDILLQVPSALQQKPFTYTPKTISELMGYAEAVLAKKSTWRRHYIPEDFRYFVKAQDLAYHRNYRAAVTKASSSTTTGGGGGRGGGGGVNDNSSRKSSSSKRGDKDKTAADKDLLAQEMAQRLSALHITAEDEGLSCADIRTTPTAVGGVKSPVQQKTVVASTKGTINSNGGDPLSAYVSLGGNAVSRLGAADLTASLNLLGDNTTATVSDDSPCPHFMMWDAVKVKYLLETGLLTAVNDAIFSAIHDPQRYSPYMIITTRLFKYAALQHLNESVTDRHLATRLFRPLLAPSISLSAAEWSIQGIEPAGSRASAAGAAVEASINNKGTNLHNDHHHIVFTGITLCEGGGGVCRIGFVTKKTIYELHRHQHAMHLNSLKMSSYDIGGGTTAAAGNDDAFTAEWGIVNPTSRSRVSTAAGGSLSSRGAALTTSGRGSSKTKTAASRTTMRKKKASLLSIQEAEELEDEEEGEEEDEFDEDGVDNSAGRGRGGSFNGVGKGDGRPMSNMLSFSSSHGRLRTGARSPGSKQMRTSAVYPPAKAADQVPNTGGTNNPPATSGGPILLSGGVFAPERVLCALGSADKVFTLGWVLPPLFPGSPERLPNIPGCRVSTSCGIALGTALHMCIPSVHKIRAKEREKMEELGSKADDQTSERRQQWGKYSENMNHTHQQTSNGSKNKGGTKKPVDNDKASVASSSRSKKNNDGGEQLDNEASGGVGSSAYGEHHDHEDDDSNNFMNAKLPDPDFGLLDVPGVIELEVVVSVRYHDGGNNPGDIHLSSGPSAPHRSLLLVAGGRLEGERRARKIFASQVADCLRYMNRSSDDEDWVLDRVIAGPPISVLEEAASADNNVTFKSAAGGGNNSTMEEDIMGGLGVSGDPSPVQKVPKDSANNSPSKRGSSSSSATTPTSSKNATPTKKSSFSASSGDTMSTTRKPMFDFENTSESLSAPSSPIGKDHLQSNQQDFSTNNKNNQEGSQPEAIDWDQRLRDLEKEQQEKEEQENVRRRFLEERRRQQKKDSDEALQAVGGLWFHVRGRGAQHTKGFHAEELRRDESTYSRVEEMLHIKGEATIYAGVYLTEASERPSAAELLTVLTNCCYKSSDKTNNKAKSNPSSSSSMKGDAELDPTKCDHDRLYADSRASKDVKALLSNATATASATAPGGTSSSSGNRTRCLVPCRIRFTLLAGSEASSPPVNSNYPLSGKQYLHPGSVRTGKDRGGGRGGGGGGESPSSRAQSRMASSRGGVGNNNFTSHPNSSRGTTASVGGGRGTGSNNAARGEGRALPLRSLVVGSEEAVARLTASTVWLSPKAARQVWLSARDIAYGSSGGYSRSQLNKYPMGSLGAATEWCYRMEVKQRWLARKHYLSAGMYPQAHEQAMICSLLRRRYDLVLPLARLQSSLGCRLRRVEQSVTWLADLFNKFTKGDSHSGAGAAASGGGASGLLSALNTTVLSHTLARHVCLALRLAVASPQSVHLRGGCFYMIKCIERLESLLCMGSIPLMASATGLPKTIVAHPTVTGESHAEAAARIISSAAVAALSSVSVTNKVLVNQKDTSTAAEVDDDDGGDDEKVSSVTGTGKQSSIDTDTSNRTRSAVASAAAKLANKNNGNKSVIVPADIYLRQALSDANTLKIVGQTLRELSDCCRTLTSSLGRDAHECLPDACRKAVSESTDNDSTSNEFSSSYASASSSSKIKTPLDLATALREHLACGGIPLKELTQDEALSFIIDTVVPAPEDTESIRRYSVYHDDHVPFPSTRRPAEQDYWRQQRVANITSACGVKTTTMGNHGDQSSSGDNSEKEEDDEEDSDEDDDDEEESSSPEQQTANLIRQSWRRITDPLSSRETQQFIDFTASRAGTAAVGLVTSSIDDFNINISSRGMGARGAAVGTGGGKDDNTNNRGSRRSSGAKEAESLMNKLRKVNKDPMTFKSNTTTGTAPTENNSNSSSNEQPPNNKGEDGGSYIFGIVPGLDPEFLTVPTMKPFADTSTSISTSAAYSGATAAPATMFSRAAAASTSGATVSRPRSMLELLRAQRGVDGFHTVQQESAASSSALANPSGSGIRETGVRAKYKINSGNHINGDDEQREKDPNDPDGTEDTVNKRSNSNIGSSSSGSIAKGHVGVDIIALPASGGMLQTLRSIQKSRLVEKEQIERKERKVQSEK